MKQPRLFSQQGDLREGVIMSDKLLISRKEAAELIGVSPDYADKHYLYERGFPVVIDERRRYYVRSLIEPWIIANKIKN